VFDFILLLGAMSIAGWIGMVAADKFVAMTQRRWRYTIRSLLIFTALVSFALAFIVAATRQ
jgi:hypothetical protein